MPEFITDASELTEEEFTLFLLLIEETIKRKPSLLDKDKPIKGLDPSDFVHIFGGDLYGQLAAKAEDWFDWLWKQALLVCDIDDPQGKADIIKGMATRIILHEDKIVQLGYFTKLSARTGIPVKLILAEADSQRGKRYAKS